MQTIQSTLSIRRAFRDDILHVAHNLRPEDESELWAASGNSPWEVLENALRPPFYTYAVVEEDEPIALFGHSEHPFWPAWGVIWMVCTPGIYPHRKEILRAAPRVLDAIFTEGRYKRLVNYADERNHLHLKWCAHLGFSLGEYCYRRNGTTFVSITKGR